MTLVEVLVTEPIMGRFAEVLTREGSSPHHWTFAFGDDPALSAAASTAEVLVCSSAPAALLGSMPRLRLVHVTGAGFDKVAMDALPPGVQVANTFHHGRSIAEHVLMVTMMLRRHVLRSDREMRAGVWSNVIVDSGHPFGGVVAGSSLGVIGLGEIGATVARTASALGMRVRAVRRNPAAAPPPGVTLDWVGGEADLPELLATSDVVVVTVPLDESTRGLIDATALARMRPDALLINVSRGAVVDEQALHDALTRGTIAGAGLDVWWRNPRDADRPPPSTLDFSHFDNVVLTPHQSGHTEEVFAGRARDITDNVDALASGQPLRNVVR
ncbi:Lactate dehydrogenase [Nocardioides terrae]|uniref:Lactate dehydrogenase n=1 Tax=Nocardioides terrae TaxID=574651 RepID=A0A1I1KFM9_9ACTN|nr:2-hydroxyacid dehydrogenase [Nocardioides terrae]SFC59335.1 Lactate dehydrogenase [Nocardioides terrae]